MGAVTKGDALSSLGRSVRAMRVREGLTQERLAGMVHDGSGKGYVSRIERGRENVSVGVLVRIARALGCRVRDLIDF